MLPNVVDIADTARVDHFMSPPFKAEPPILVNGDLMPNEFRPLYESVWNQERPPTEVVCHVLCNAVVDGPGLIFDSEGNLIRQSIHQTTTGEIEAAYGRLRAWEAADAVPWEPGVTLMCEKAGLSNYGHWLVEMLPIVWLNRHHLHSPGGWFVRLPVATPVMNKIFEDSMELLSIPKDQIRRRRPCPQRYEQLVFVTGLAQHGIWYSPLIVDCLNELGSDVAPEPAADIWVSRAGLRRSIANEAELTQILSQRGWRVIEPGQHSLRQQIALFKGARTIAGVNGAGLTNLVFAPSATDVLSFMPARMPDVFFWMLSNFKGQRFHDIRVQHDVDVHNPKSFETTIQLTPNEVIALLARCLR